MHLFSNVTRNQTLLGKHTLLRFHQQTILKKEWCSKKNMKLQKIYLTPKPVMLEKKLEQKQSGVQIAQVEMTQ